MGVPKVLIVHDEADIRELIELTLLPMGLECHPAETLAGARTLLGEHSFALCITDMRLPDGNGLDLVGHIARRCPETPVAVITAHGNVELAVEALKLGAFDFVSKPFDIEVLRTLATTALKMSRPRRDGRRGGDKDDKDEKGPVLLGDSPAMEGARRLIHKLARSQAPILISGESGTGKEVAARLIHASGPRWDKPFVPVNCGAIPEHLMESEFFGYTKGSFTGASHDKIGLFQAAQGGTLFLDEVADLPAHMQVKLLRAIQERAVRPVGSQQEVPVDVRIVSASHQDLAALVEQGQFRQDLYYRLNVIELRMPALRERPEDIPALAERILARLATELSIPTPRLTTAATAVLSRYPFPGNVRELENILERAFTLSEGESIGAEDLHLPAIGDGFTPRAPRVARTGAAPTPAGGAREMPPETPSPDPETAGLEGYLEELERSAIMEALEATRFNKTAAAQKLGISFRALRYRLKKLGID